MKLLIQRSYSRTKQIAAFEPINAFCSVQMETDITEPITADEEVLFKKAIAMYSAGLDEIVRSEVEKTIDAEIARRKSPDHSKIQDSAKAEAEHDGGQQALDLIIDKEPSPKSGFHEIN